MSSNNYTTATYWREIEANHLPLAFDESGEMDASKIETAIGQASKIADSYLASRYTLPITSPAQLDVIEAQIIAIVTYELARGAGANSDDITERNKQAVAWFNGIARGHIDLPAAGSGAGDIATGQLSDAVFFSSKPRRV